MSMTMDPRPSTPGGMTPRAVLLLVSKEMADRGEEITYEKLSRSIGRDAHATRMIVSRMIKAGLYPYEVATTRRQLRSQYLRADAVAMKIHAEGRGVGYAEISAETGIPTNRLWDVVKWARTLGLWRVEIAGETGGSLEDRIRVAREAAANGKNKLTEADIERRKAEVLAESLAGMIDGSQEQDDTPPGVPPRSGKDHSAWSRMEFEDPSSLGYERTRYRVTC